jgi:thiol-disulfide isomerase/thioredoxin
MAPDFTLADLDGHNVTLSDYRGHPVWINLWATWCVPCKSEMPAMQQLYNRYKGQGLVILGANAQEEPSRVADYVRQGGYDWRFLLDPGGVVSYKYLFGGVPSHVFIDRAGVIRAISVGELDAAGMANYLARIVDPLPGG